MSTEIIRAVERHVWRDAALFSRQSFPATGNFDLAAGAFGLLLVHNDDVVSPGEGFDMHSHRDVEIITWVLAGRIRHRDSGDPEVTELGPHQAQHISAGSGIRHSEVNAAGYLSREHLRVVQSWLPADRPGTHPFHRSHDFRAALAATGALIPVASGTPRVAPLTIGTAGATLWAAHLAPGDTLQLPTNAFVHCYLSGGSVELADHRVLSEGDALRLTGWEKTRIHSPTGAELLIWEMTRQTG